MWVIELLAILFLIGICPPLGAVVVIILAGVFIYAKLGTGAIWIFSALALVAIIYFIGKNVGEDFLFYTFIAFLLIVLVVALIMLVKSIINLPRDLKKWRKENQKREGRR